MGLMPVADALAAVLSGANALPEEMVALDSAYKRILARDLAALRTQPPQAMSAMDGYAVRAADAARAGARLKVIGEIAAGRPFDRIVGPGEAVRIFTGGVVPDGADAVIIQEDTVVEGDGIAITEAAIAGRHIRRAGVDFRQGDVLLKAGRELSDRDLSLAAAMNYPAPARPPPAQGRPARHRRRTGDAGRGARARPDRLFQRLRAAGACPCRGRRGDRPRHCRGYAFEPPRAEFAAPATVGADILITTGGASVGDHDLVKQALDAEGVAMAFWRIAMRPGKPLMHGRLGAMRVIGLPGNPVSSYVCAFLFLVPLICKLCGRLSIHHTTESALLGRDIAANDQREDYLRARLSTRDDGALIVTPVDHQDSSLLGNLAAAQALLIRPPFAPQAKAGAACNILRLPA